MSDQGYYTIQEHDTCYSIASKLCNDGNDFSEILCNPPEICLNMDNLVGKVISYDCSKSNQCGHCPDDYRVDSTCVPNKYTCNPEIGCTVDNENGTQTKEECTQTCERNKYTCNRDLGVCATDPDGTPQSLEECNAGCTQQMYTCHHDKPRFTSQVPPASWTKEWTPAKCTKDDNGTLTKYECDQQDKCELNYYLCNYDTGMCVNINDDERLKRVGGDYKKDCDSMCMTCDVDKNNDESGNPDCNAFYNVDNTKILTTCRQGSGDPYGTDGCFCEPQSGDGCHCSEYFSEYGCR